MLDMVSSLIMIAAVAIATFATRAASFVVFPKGKEVPPTVKYIGMVLPPAVIGMLVVYCLRSTQLLLQARYLIRRLYKRLLPQLGRSLFL